MAPRDDNGPSSNGQAWTVLRIIQFLTLVVIFGIAASFINEYNNAGVNTPNGVMLLFVVSLIAALWTLTTLIFYFRSNTIPLWIVFWDIVFLALLIAGVVMLGDVTNENCRAYYDEWRETSWYRRTTTTTTSTVDPNDEARKIILGETVTTTSDGDRNAGNSGYSKPCSLLKTIFGLAIANIILFFITALLGIGVYRERRQRKDRNYYKEEIIETGTAPSRTVIEEKIYTERERPATPPSVYLAGGGGSVYDEPSASAVGGYERRRSRERSVTRTHRSGSRSHRRSGSRRRSSRVYPQDDGYHRRSSRDGRRMDREGPRSSVGYVRGV